MTRTDTELSTPLPGVLLVDDDSAILDVMRRMLQNVPCQLFAASSIPEAEKYLANQAIQVILCDHVLPGESGMNFLGRLRHSHPNIRRIIITGHSSEELVLQGINEAAIQRFIAKPFTIETIRGTVTQALEEYQRLLERECMEKERDQLLVDLHGWRGRCTRQGAILQTMAGNFAMFALRVAVVIALVISALAAITGLLFFFLYVIKVLFGFDLMPNIHLDDLV